MQSSLAVSVDGDRWILVNVSPDIAHQISATPRLWPRTRRGTPIAGAVFTDANIDHVGGLAELRQDGSHRFTFWSSAVVKQILAPQPAFARFMQPPHAWNELAAGASIVDGALTFEAIGLPGTTPGYAGREPASEAVFAYLVTDTRSQRRAVIAPVFAKLNDALNDALRDAAVAFLDGTFFSEDELRSGGYMAKSASHLGHAPLAGAGGTLERVRNARARIILTHINNTNPILRSDSDASKVVAAARCEIAYDGMEIEV
jgi:pyrroloquinoline quinone biosynthesis protein B